MNALNIVSKDGHVRQVYLYPDLEHLPEYTPEDTDNHIVVYDGEIPRYAKTYAPEGSNVLRHPLYADIVSAFQGKDDLQYNVVAAHTPRFNEGYYSMRRIASYTTGPTYELNSLTEVGRLSDFVGECDYVCICFHGCHGRPGESSSEGSAGGKGGETLVWTVSVGPVNAKITATGGYGGGGGGIRKSATLGSADGGAGGPGDTLALYLPATSDILNNLFYFSLKERIEAPEYYTGENGHNYPGGYSDSWTGPADTWGRGGCYGGYRSADCQHVMIDGESVPTDVIPCENTKILISTGENIIRWERVPYRAVEDAVEDRIALQYGGIIIYTIKL